MAQTSYDRAKKQKHHVYDDQTIENMARYYRLEENFDELIKYIKSRRLHEDAV